MEKNIKENQELCEKIWNECKDDLTKLCRYKLQSCPDEIDDVVAETFFYLCKAVFADEEVFNYKSWMMAVANNLIKKKYSEINRMKSNRVQVADIEEETICCTNEDIFIDNLVTDGMIENLSQEVIHNLSPDEQKLYNYVYEEKLKLKEIAEKMNTTEAAIKQKHYRLNKKLKLMLKEHLESMWMK